MEEDAVKGSFKVSAPAGMGVWGQICRGRGFLVDGRNALLDSA